jgi:L-cysteine:1D-myo-inositol 2-amino-2-deoxy-alpha-D-glucopyranoside ligase
MAIRLALLAQHYRADREWFPATLARAEERLARWRSAVALPAGPSAEPVLDRVRDRFADDLDTPACLTAVDRWAEEALARGGPSIEAPELIRALADALLGVAL